MPQHAAVIAVTILDRPTCLDCIAVRSGVNHVEVKRYLDRIQKVLTLVLDEDACRVCGAHRAVFLLKRPS